MSWKLPRKVPVAGQIPDAQDLNDGFRPFTEADGRLSEGNFAETMAGQLAQHTDIAEDIALRSMSIRANQYAGGPVASATYAQVPIGPGWTRVEDLVRTLNVETGPLLVMVSLQAGRESPGDGVAARAQRAYMHSRFALRVDGSVVPHSVVGDQDSSTEGEGMELGLWNYLQGVDIFCVVPVGPGSHTVEVVAQAEGSVTTDLASASESLLVYSRELVVVEVK